MNICDENQVKINFLSKKVNVLKSEISAIPDESSLYDFKDKITDLIESEHKLIECYDVESTKKVMEQLNFLSKYIFHTMNEYKQGLKMNEEIIYIQIGNTNIILEFDIKNLSNNTNEIFNVKNTDQIFHKGSVYQLLYKGHKQILNIPIINILSDKLNLERVQQDIKSLSKLLIKFLLNVYAKEIDNHYILKCTDDIGVEYNLYETMAYIVIPSLFFNNFNEKVAFIEKFREYTFLHGSKKMPERIGHCVSHNTIPQIEIITIPYDKNINNYVNLVSLNYVKNVQHIGKIVETVLNTTPTVIPIKPITILPNNQNNTPVDFDSIFKIDKYETYINCIISRHLDWHTNNSEVSVALLYKYYANYVRGNANKEKFCKFIASLPFIYVKITSIIGNSMNVLYKISYNIELFNNPINYLTPVITKNAGKLNILYLIQSGTDVHLKNNVYKIGKTTNEYILRYKQYPKDSKTILCISTIHISCHIMEKILIKAFKKKFTRIRGLEYFVGDINHMRKLFLDLINKYDKTTHDNIAEDNYDESNNSHDNSSNVNITGPSVANNIQNANVTTIDPKSKSKLDHKQDYITFVTTTPPVWHKKGEMVNFTKLYELYQSIGGTSTRNQFGLFLKNCKTLYSKNATPYYKDGHKIIKYTILR